MSHRRASRTPWWLAALMICAVAATSCGSSGSSTGDGDSDGASVPIDERRCGDPDRLGDSLSFYNWADYMDPEVLVAFEQECGVRVTMDIYPTNQALIARLRAGGSGYSLAVPTDYAAQILIEEDLALSLDMGDIANAANLDPERLGQFYDPDNVYTLPFLYSTTGFAYDETQFDTAPTSWSALFDQNGQCSSSSLLNEQYETVGAALAYLGHPWNSDDPAAHADAAELLLEARDCISAFDSANLIGNLVSGEVAIAQIWGFAAGIARVDNPDIQYVVPDEGALLWQDNLLIPADAPDPYTAHAFINFMLEPDIGAMIAEWTFGFTPNLAAEELLSERYYEIIDGGGIAITDEMRSRLFPSLSRSRELFAETWNQIVTAS